jgi:lipopolysaccharide export LptBFGC system permease protein LptF
MKIIERYILTSFLTAFFLAWMVFSFVLTIGLLVKIAQLIMRGVPFSTIGLFIMIGFPGTLALTIPLALMVSSLLVFSRLSADSEIAAMRACGINLLSVMKYPVLFSICCTFLSIFINNEIVPRSAEARKRLRTTISVNVGLDLLEPGRIISDFPKVKLFFAQKQGNWLKKRWSQPTGPTSSWTCIKCVSPLLTSTSRVSPRQTVSGRSSPMRSRIARVHAIARCSVFLKFARRLKR